MNIIPADNYTVVGDYVLDGSKLKTYLGSKEHLIIPASFGLTEIDDYAISWNGTIRSVILSEGITRIGNSAFAYMCLDKVILPESLREIDDEAFYYIGLLGGSEFLVVPEG